MLIHSRELLVFIIKYFNPYVDDLPKKCLNLMIPCGLGVKIESRVERTHPEKSLHKFNAKNKSISEEFMSVTFKITFLIN